MQRASANPSKSAASSGDSFPAKRRKVADGPSLPGSPVEKAKQNETHDAFEVKRLQALEKQGREFGETKWVLKREYQALPEGPSSRLQIRVAGYGHIDSASETEHDLSGSPPGSAKVSGRATFGDFRPKGQNSVVSVWHTPYGMFLASNDYSTYSELWRE